MKYASKRDLITQIESEHQGFVELIESIPRNQFNEPGVWGDDWTIKDLVAHLTEWEQMFLRWHREGTAGRKPAMPAEGYKWSETRDLNRAIWKKHKNTSWKRVRDAFDRSFDEVLGLAKSLSENELLEPGQFEWTGKNALTTYLGANTCSHYRTASKIIKRWQRQQAKK